jgi:hypothetical protein
MDQTFISVHICQCRAHAKYFLSLAVQKPGQVETGNLNSD